MVERKMIADFNNGSLSDYFSTKASQKAAILQNVIKDHPEESFNYPFDKFKEATGVQILTSPDGQMRLYQWSFDDELTDFVGYIIQWKHNDKYSYETMWDFGDETYSHPRFYRIANVPFYKGGAYLLSSNSDDIYTASLLYINYEKGYMYYPESWDWHNYSGQEKREAYVFNYAILVPNDDNQAVYDSYPATSLRFDEDVVLNLPQDASKVIYPYTSLTANADATVYLGIASDQVEEWATDCFWGKRQIISLEPKSGKLKVVLSHDRLSEDSDIISVKCSPFDPSILYFSMSKTKDNNQASYSHYSESDDSYYYPYYGITDIDGNDVKIRPGDFIGCIESGKYKGCYAAIEPYYHKPSQSIVLFLNVYYEHASYADRRAAGSIQIPSEDFVYNCLEWLEEMTDEYNLSTIKENGNQNNNSETSAEIEFSNTIIDINSSGEIN